MFNCNASEMPILVSNMQIREAPQRGHHRFIEFYDVRAAEASLHALNRSDIAGKKIKLEPSPPVGARRWYCPISLATFFFFLLDLYLFFSSYCLVHFLIGSLYTKSYRTKIDIVFVV